VLRALLALGLLAVGNCRHDDGAQVHPDAGAPTGQVIFEPTGKADAPVDIWVASTEPEREKGLMYVRGMPDHEGMLFVFEDDSVRTFWMKNTYIPLDMIFVDENKRVVGVVEDAEPMTTTTRTVGKPSRYVVEVNAGWARNHGIAEGTPCIIRNAGEVTP
jgi:uncharacterized membrane protein (UPF0127 family)